MIENQVRSVALGRKNPLFAGSHEDAKRAALINTLMSTAARHGVERWAYLKDVLARLSAHPANKVADLLLQN